VYTTFFFLPGKRDETETRLRTLRQLESDEARTAAAEIQHLRRILTEQARLEKFLAHKSTPRQVQQSHKPGHTSAAVPFLAATAATTLAKEPAPKAPVIAFNQRGGKP
jgi:hypothetical protein